MKFDQWVGIAVLIIVISGAFTMSLNSPRGIRNNNPGNIRRGQPWQGLASIQDDSAFAVFVSPEYGLRALGKTLQTYQRKYGIRTIREAITRWAPPSENNTEAYVLSVSQHVGASPDAPLDFSKKVVLVPMMEAITRHENGQQPYSAATLAKAAELAGAVA